MASTAGRNIPAATNSIKKKLKPVIKELIRTQVCPEKLELLLDHLSVQPVDVNGRRRETYRMWLGDGEVAIQALLKHELHPFVNSGEIHEGSYLLIDGYHLAQLPRQSGNDFVWVIMISSLDAAGSDGREPQPLKIESIPVSTASRPPRGKSERGPSDLEVDVQANRSKPKVEIGYEEPRESEIVKNIRNKSPSLDGFSDLEDQSQSFQTPQKPKRRLSAGSDQLSPSDRGIEPQAKKQKTANSKKDGEAHKQTLEDTIAAPKPSNGHQAGQATPPLSEIQRPLRIMPLSKLTGPQTVRNKVHDVLAVVCEIDVQVIRRRGMPAQRNLRIIDTSTPKRVQLTVFVDAENFTPKVGTVALFRNVTTHEWNGGSLKAYQRDCNERHWFFPNPVDVEGVEREKLDQLREHWEQVLEGEESD